MEYTKLQKAVLRKIDEYGGIRAAAAALKVSPSYLSRLGAGKKDNPNKELLEKLGIKRVVTHIEMK